MPRTHDGISCPLRPTPIGLVLGVIGTGVGVWLLAAGSLTAGALTPGRIALGAGLVFVGLLMLLNQKGTRRIRVIHSKLLVEDEHWIMALLIGPNRRRVGWEEVRSVAIDGGRLRCETAGAPFVTAEGATPEDLKILLELAQAALDKARAEAGAAARESAEPR